MTSTSTLPYRIPFAGIGYRYGSEEARIVAHAMENSSTYTQGPHQGEFEAAFAKFLQSDHRCFATSSAAAAIELAAILSGVGPGDEVIIPAHTYNASAYPFARRGAQIRWADIDESTFVMDPASVQSLISPATKVIVAVHLYGLPVDMHPILRMAEERNIYVVEDCAQSIGAVYRGAIAGTLGDMSVFSFQSHKNISTLGEGGMLAVADPELARHVAGLRHNGHRDFPRNDDRYWYPAMSDVAFDLPGEWPHNFCMGEIQAALGTHLLSKVPDINDKRRARFQTAVAALAPFPELKFQHIPSDRLSSHHLLPFKYVGDSFDRTNHDFIRELAYGRGIQCATQYYPLNRYSLFEESGNGDASVPVTDAFFDNMVSLPFHSWMTDNDFTFMLEQVADVAHKLRSS